MKCPHCDGAGVLAPERVTVSTKILTARLAAGLTQAELAAKSGVGRAQIANIETGRSQPTIANLQRIAAGLGVKAGELLP